MPTTATEKPVELRRLCRLLAYKPNSVFWTGVLGLPSTNKHFYTPPPFTIMGVHLAVSLMPWYSL